MSTARRPRHGDSSCDRELKPVLRDPFSVVFSMIQPLFFLALFAPLLTSVTGLGQGSSLQWFVPGIVVMSCLFGASMTGSNLLIEMQTGSHERMLVTPLSRSSLLLGRALKEIVPVVVQAVDRGRGRRAVQLRGAPGRHRRRAADARRCSASGWARCPTRWRWPPGQDWIFWTVQQTLPVPGAAAGRHAAAGRRRPRLAADAVGRSTR